MGIFCPRLVDDQDGLWSFRSREKAGFKDDIVAWNVMPDTAILNLVIFGEEEYPAIGKAFCLEDVIQRLSLCP